MSKLDRKTLEAKERQLRKELNQASDEIESQVVKAVGLAIIGGLVSYGIHKLVSPKKKAKKKKDSSNQSNQKSAVSSSKKVQSNSPGTLARLGGAIIPILISNIGSELLEDREAD